MARKKLWLKALELAFGLLKWVFTFLFNVLAAVAKLFWRLLAAFGNAFKKSAAESVRTASEAAAPKALSAPLAEVKVFEGSLAAFQDWLYSSKSTVGIILGARGAGKSGLGLYLVENWAARGRKTFAMGFEGARLPAWVREAQRIEDVPNNSVLLVDEGGILFNSRDAMSDANKLLSKLLFIARHKDLSVAFISQNSANLEVNTIRQADYLLLKRPSLLQKDFERSKIKEIYDSVEDEFKKLGADKGLTYVYSDKFRGFASNPLPSFWTDKTSKAFGKAVLRK
ncbi:hypothetical protein H0O03_01470 [Candidatus Micrarchaeota archaeon]|nr:hypothetical protein [Candidatus Micrarchaeota archaeon]